MKKLIVSIVGIAFLFPSGWSNGSNSPDSRCRVLEVIKIHSPYEFTCRIDQWKGINNLRLRVKIRNVSIPEGEDSDPVTDWIRHRLDVSEGIRLHHIEPRNYFRVVADVSVGRFDLVEAMLKEGILRPHPSEPPQEVPDRNDFLSVRDRLVEKDLSARLIKPQSKSLYSKESLEKVLATEVDLSMLDSATPLREALEIIRLSVDPPLPMVVIWSDLQQTLYLDPDMPIGVDGFTRISPKLAMELILSSVSPGAIRPVAVQEENLLLIVSSRFASQRMKSGVYDIRELASIPASADENSERIGGSTSSNSGGSGR
jgi:hypothetical protein